MDLIFIQTLIIMIDHINGVLVKVIWAQKKILRLVDGLGFFIAGCQVEILEKKWAQVVLMQA